MRVAGFAIALGLAACAPEGGNAAPEPLWKTSWIAESVAGAPVAPPGVITLTFTDGQVNGNGGCNSYMGGVTITGAKIKFGSLASTKMACLDGGRMQQEANYHTVLRDAVRYERPSAFRLEIVTQDGRRVVFAAKR